MVRQNGAERKEERGKERVCAHNPQSVPTFQEIPSSFHPCLTTLFLKQGVSLGDGVH